MSDTASSLRRPPGERAGDQGRDAPICRWEGAPGWLLAVAVGFATALVRWLFARPRTVPDIPGDEGAHLAIARTLGGDVDWFSRTLSYQPGFGVLISPVHWFTDDPEATYRSALAVIAVLGGVSALMLVRIAIRVTNARLAWIGVSVVVASCLPGVLIQGLWATSEALVTTAFVATMLATLRLLDRPNFLRAAMAGALAGSAFTVHGRLGPLAVAVLLVVTALVLRRDLSFLAGLGSLLVGLATLVVLTLAATAVFDAVWTTIDPGERADRILANLSDPLGLLASGLGMLWYQLVTTAGLVGLGAWTIAAGLWRPRLTQDVGVTRAHAAVLATLTIAAMVLPITHTVSTERVDFMIYGRYWDAVMGPVVVLGLCLLATTSKRSLIIAGWWVAGLMVAVGALLTAIRQSEMDAAFDSTGPPGRFRSVGIYSFLMGGETLDIPSVTGTATAILLGLLALAWLRSLVESTRAVTALLGFTVLALVATANLAVHGTWGYSNLMRWLNRLESVSAVGQAVQREGIPAGDPILFRMEGSSLRYPEQTQLWMAYQFYVPTNPLPLRLSEQADARYAFAPRNDPELIADGASLVWRDPISDYGLWVRKAGERSRSAAEG